MGRPLSTNLSSSLLLRSNTYDFQLQDNLQISEFQPTLAINTGTRIAYTGEGHGKVPDTATILVSKNNKTQAIFQ